MNAFEKDVQKKIIDSLMQLFDYNLPNAVRWLSTDNPYLGEFTPLKLINTGKSERVYNFIEANKGENTWK